MKLLPKTKPINFWLTSKTWRVMKLTSILVIALTLQVSASVSSQTVTFSGKNVMIKKVLSVIKNQTNYVFFYDVAILKNVKPITLNVVDSPIESVLQQAFVGQPITWIIEGKTISFVPKAEKIYESINLEAQKHVKGKVVDEKGLPIPGANVQAKGGKTGVQTDLDGNFSIDVDENVTKLVVSFIGMEQQEVAIGKSELTIVLKEQGQKLDEVVVVGYGTQKKTNLTGAVGVIKSSEIVNKPISQVTQAIQGKIAGVYVNIGQSDPGDEKGTIRIRGVGTLNDPNPLTLVDGIEAPINSVNPTDIETITVLKDAASASIYGSRGANGVVLITTKRGHYDKAPEFEYSSLFGLQQPTTLPKLVTDPKTYLTLYERARLNSNLTSLFTPAQIEAHANDPATNWAKEIFRNDAPYLQQSISARGGSKYMAYNFSLGHLKQEGILKFNSDYARVNGRANLDFRISDKVTGGTSLSFAQGDITSLEDLGNSRFGVGGSREAFIEALRSHPLVPVYDDLGRLAYKEVALNIPGGTNNAIAVAKNMQAFTKQKEFLGSVYLQWEIIKNLKIKATFSVNDQATTTTSRLKPYQLYDWKTGVLASTNLLPGTLSESQIGSQNVTSWLQANYEKKWGDHSLKALFGINQETSKNKQVGYTVQGFSNPDFIYGSTATGIPTVTGTEGEWALSSFFGSLDYSYKNRYLLKANLRRDGSSRFGKNNRFATFPSFSAGWIISQEEFWKVNFVDFFKLRASWGKLGNQNTALYPSYATVNLATPYGANSGAALTSLGNPDLKWEETQSTDIGTELSLFKRKLNIEFDWFSRRTTGILFDIDNPGVSGLPVKTTTNLSTIDNKGWELTASYNFNIKKVGVSIGGNVTNIENKVVAINPALTDNADLFFFNDFTRSNGKQVIARGHSVNSIYGYQVLGIFQSTDEISKAPDHSTLFGGLNPAPGDFRIADLNGDNKITISDREVIGKETPSWLFAFNAAVNYANFDLSINFQGIADVDKYLGRGIPNPFDQNGGITTEWTNSWTPENPSTSLPRVFLAGAGYNGNVSRQTQTFNLYDKSFLRLKNLQLGYTIPKTTMNKIGVNKLYVYVVGKNLLTFTKFPQVDPESAEGLSFAGHALPQIKSFSVGLNINF